MARKVYMVDTENVSSSWRMMLADMTRNDILYLFYTEHSPGIGYADFKEIIKSETKPELISCYPGKNGLDFQLVSYLGYLLKSAGKTEYIIISNDMGYDCVIHFWKEQGYKVSRMTVYDLIQRKKARITQQKQEKIEKIPQEKKETNLAMKESSSLEETIEKLEVKEIAATNIQIEEQKKEFQQEGQETLLYLPQKTVSAEIVVSKETEITGKRGKRKKQIETEIIDTSASIHSGDAFLMEAEKEDSNQDENENGRKLLAKLLSAHDVDVDTVIEILRHGSPHQLQKVYTQMLKLFGHQTGVELYHVLKPHFSALFTYAKNGLEHGIDL